MKNLLRYLAFVMMVGVAFAQSNLPPCADGIFGVFSNPANWSNCFGTANISGDKFKGDSYVGEFQDGKFHGQGKYLYLNGSTYIGEWKNGLRDGQGTFTIPNVGNYVGEFKDGKVNGQGIDTYVKGNKYVGNFKDGKQDGQGTFFHLADGPGKGDKYVGNWKDGQRSGQGAYIKVNGNVVIAEFSDGLPNGRSIEYKPDGVIYRSGIHEKNIFVREEYVSPSIFNRIPSDTNPVIANFQRFENERLDAEAKVRLHLEQEYSLSVNSKSSLPFCRGSDVYINRWTDCFGISTYADGEKYIGEFKNGTFNGRGTFITRNGQKLVGEWKDGKIFNSQNQQQESESDSEVARLRAEAEQAKRKQVELEAQLRLAQQPVTQQSSPSNISSRNSKRVALVIGNANYSSAPLKNPLNDAADISTALRQSGFEVIDQRNATLQEMTRGIREFGDKLLKSDVGLVYYSGHGLEVKGRNYLLPVNASMIREDEIAFQAVDANLILEKMNTAKKSVNILIVDACRDNPFARSFRSVNRGLAQMDAPTGTIVSFSTAPGKTASDGDGRNSPFTKNLVKAMMRADMPIETMFKEVRKSVVEETKGQQTPWESSSLIGDFYFKASK